jgi:hypothetical protein
MTFWFSATSMVAEEYVFSREALARQTLASGGKRG